MNAEQGGGAWVERTMLSGEGCEGDGLGLKAKPCPANRTRNRHENFSAQIRQPGLADLGQRVLSFPLCHSEAVETPLPCLGWETRASWSIQQEQDDPGRGHLLPAALPGHHSPRRSLRPTKALPGPGFYSQPRRVGGRRDAGFLPFFLSWAPGTGQGSGTPTGAGRELLSLPSQAHFTSGQRCAELDQQPLMGSRGLFPSSSSLSSSSSSSLARAGLKFASFHLPWCWEDGCAPPHPQARPSLDATPHGD